MGVTDVLNYALFTNPISSTATSYAWSAASTAKHYLVPQPKIELKMVHLPLWKLAAASGPYVRLAGLSGAAAVILGAYGSHRSYPPQDSKQLDRKQVFETANRYHFIHTLAMLGLPLCRAPFWPAVLFLSGIITFSGSCYYYAFTGDKRFSKVTPLGGLCFIGGWLTMLF